jgi:hypothetical protein
MGEPKYSEPRKIPALVFLTPQLDRQ